MTAGEGLPVLQSKVAWLSGGRDRDGRPVIAAIIDWDAEPQVGDVLDQTLRYLSSCLSEATLLSGLTLLLDARKCPWKVARSAIRVATQAFGSNLATFIVLRPDAFWDKQRVDCTKVAKDGKPIYIPISRLYKFIDASQLTEEFGGTYPYNHTHWLHNRTFIESYLREAETVVSDLTSFQQRLQDFTTGDRIRTSSDPISFSKVTFDNNRIIAQAIYQKGTDLVKHIEKTESECQQRTPGEKVPQDMTDTRVRVELILEKLQQCVDAADRAWGDLQKKFVDAREIEALEGGVAGVTRWILDIAEALLNSQYQVGYDVPSSEELRSDHETLELQCRETYGQYAELLHKIDTLPRLNIPIPEDLRSQRDFMDFVCRSFASRLERRRNILITCLRFYRLVTEYFGKTSEVFERLVLYTDTESLESADDSLLQLHHSQINIDYLAKELVREGEKLSDLLSMPVKDALGREIDVNYESDILNVQEILQASISRKQLFSDSVDLQKLTLEQVTHIHIYEKDTDQAVQWLNDLFGVLMKNIHVGCSVHEIQLMKEELQVFQETAKGTYEYGCQLVSAALALRRSCKLADALTLELQESLQAIWQRLEAVTQEQMTRLRVCAVFHRTVDEHCNQLKELQATATALSEVEDTGRRWSKTRRCLQTRERLLMEVGRMVRLGRLLKTRLKEPLFANIEAPEEGNATSVEAISERLSEVTELAEQLDVALSSSQAGGSVSPTMKKAAEGITTSAVAEDWCASSKVSNKTPNTSSDSKSEDEFITASECTCTPPSRSSSFQTASEGGAASPWWEVDPTSDSDERAKAEKAKQAVLRVQREMATEIVVREVTETTKLKMSSGEHGVTSFTLETSTSHLRPDMNPPITKPPEESLEPTQTSEIVRQLSQIVRSNEDTSSQYSCELLEADTSHCKSLSADTDATDGSLPRFSSAAPAVRKPNPHPQDDEEAYRKELQRFAPDENAKIYIIDASTPSPKSTRYLETSFDEDPNADMEARMREVRELAASSRPSSAALVHRPMTPTLTDARSRRTVDVDRRAMTLDVRELRQRRDSGIRFGATERKETFETFERRRPVTTISLQESFPQTHPDYYCPPHIKRMAIQGIF